MFHDHFSIQAIDYAKYRPHYPTNLFKYLASLVPTHDVAWDCATGNGQAALGLSPYFKQIIATDASAQQISQATLCDNVTYCVALAEETHLADRSIDLITIAQALHWFHFDQFYAEVKRVLKKQGIIAAWTYPLLRIIPEIDQIVDKFYYETLATYWPPERCWVDTNYEQVPFPFQLVNTPVFSMQAAWHFEHLLGYLATWSAVQRYQTQHQENPIASIVEVLQQAWGNVAEEKNVSWQIILKVGRFCEV